MNTTAFEHVLTGALAYMGLQRDRLNVLDFDRIRSWAEEELRNAWEQEEWPELIKVEQRFFRPDYATGTAYTNDGTIVYFPQTRKYYHALVATTGNPPADAADTLDSSRWALAQEEYTAANYAATAAYIAGSQVYYPTDGNFYQCHTAGTGNLPTDTSYWGRLYTFDRFVAYEQTGLTAFDDPVGVYEENPRIHRDARKIAYDTSDNGVQIFEDVAHIWLAYRSRVPELTGAEFDATATYAVGDQIYYRSATVPGDFYDCAVVTTAGQDPDDTPASWTRIEVPWRFKEILKNGIFAQSLSSQQQEERAAIVRGKRDKLLAKQVAKLRNQLNQRRTPVVLTR